MTTSWDSGPKGDAIEAKKGFGVGFFFTKGDLLCVIFDEIKSDKDHQILEFQHTSVEVTVEKGQVGYKITQPKTKSHFQKRRLAQKKIVRVSKRTKIGR